MNGGGIGLTSWSVSIEGSDNAFAHFCTMSRLAGAKFGNAATDANSFNASVFLAACANAST